MKLKLLYEKYGYFLYVLVVPLYLILFFVTEGIVDSNSDYWVSYLPIDDSIPFCEWFIIPYVSWYGYLLATGIFLLCREPDGARRYLINIGLSFNAFIGVSLLFPNGQNMRVDIDGLGRDNFCLDILRWIYSADTNTNVCPSIHAVGTICAVTAVLLSKEIRSRLFKAAFTVWGLLIICATVFLKQHSILDVIVAVPYAAIFGVISYKLVSFKRRYEPIVKGKREKEKLKLKC